MLPTMVFVEIKKFCSPYGKSFSDQKFQKSVTEKLSNLITPYTHQFEWGLYFSGEMQNM